MAGTANVPLLPAAPAARRSPWRIAADVWLLAPALLFLAIFFVAPIAVMIRNGFNTQDSSGVMVPGLTLANYIRFFSGDLYLRVLWTTIRVGLVTTLVAGIVAFPVAIAVARGPRTVARFLILIVVAPLLVNIVTRTFGWRIVLGRTGVLNYLADAAGIPGDFSSLYTETAIVVGSLHVFLPLMALPLANSIAAIPRTLEESAAALGAGSAETFLKVVLPLSLPGLGAGGVLVFTLTTSSFVLPAILGGDFSKMLGTLVEEQLLAVSNWPFGAAIATILMLINLAVVAGYYLAIERRVPGLAGRRS